MIEILADAVEIFGVCPSKVSFSNQVFSLEIQFKLAKN